MPKDLVGVAKARTFFNDLDLFLITADAHIRFEPIKRRIFVSTVPVSLLLNKESRSVNRENLSHPLPDLSE